MIVVATQQLCELLPTSSVGSNVTLHEITALLADENSLRTHITNTTDMFRDGISSLQQQQSGVGDDCVLGGGAHFAADLSGLGEMESVS